MTRRKYWLPLGLIPFFIVVVATFYFFLIAFDPHTERNPAEWGPRKANPKKAFWMRVIEKQINKK